MEKALLIYFDVTEFDKFIQRKVIFMVYVFLAEGFEETEAVVTIDILRRGYADVKTVSISGDKSVTGAHGITLMADIAISEVKKADAEAFILPGGMPGTTNLAESEEVKELLLYGNENDKLICAICAAPSVLGKLGILKGKRAVCYPGFEDYLDGAKVYEVPVMHDGNIITSRGAGTAHLFAVEILTALKGDLVAEPVVKGMLYE